MSFFRQIAYYFSVYRKYIGNRLLIVFGLSGLAALTEGIGIAMLLPLMAAADVGLGETGESTSGILAVLRDLLNLFNIGDSMVGILLFIAVIFLLKGLIVFIAQGYQSHLQAQLLRELKSLMFTRYSTMDYNYYCRRNTGHFVNIITLQIDSLVLSFTNYKTFLSMSITAAVYFATAFLFAWNFALMAVVAGGVLLLLFRGINNLVLNLSRQTTLEQTTLNKFLVQSLHAYKYLAATAETRHLQRAILQSIGKLSGYFRGRGIAHAVTESLSEPIAIFFVLLVIIIQVVVLDTPLAPIFVALILFNRSMGSIMGIQRAWQQTLSKIGALEAVETEFQTLSENREQSGNRRLEPFSRNIAFENVTFTYPGSRKPVLRDISLDIPVNANVAVVGESGAGKSTLIDILTLILRPNRGRIHIDGVPGNEIDLTSWRQQIGYVSQETVVFDDSVANNIALWKADYHHDADARTRIKQAAVRAYADRFIRELPDRYDTLVGDRGVRLSGGQRQRLFLARELYKNPRLLILDEATSALDSESEQYIQKSIDALRGQTTVVVIAHRLSTIMNADMIYVMDKGRIIESGSYAELMAHGGRFERMVRHQVLTHHTGDDSAAETHGNHPAHP